MASVTRRKGLRLPSERKNKIKREKKYIWYVVSVTIIDIEHAVSCGSEILLHWKPLTPHHQPLRLISAEILNASAVYNASNHKALSRLNVLEYLSGIRAHVDNFLWLEAPILFQKIRERTPMKLYSLKKK
jgi:hypothetical protein